MILKNKLNYLLQHQRFCKPASLLIRQNQNGASIVDNYHSLKPKPASRFSTVRWGPDDSVRTYPNSSDDPNNDTLYQFFKKGSSDVLPYKMYDGNKLMPTSIYHK
jgi:hypothetical protein